MSSIPVTPMTPPAESELYRREPFVADMNDPAYSVPTIPGKEVPSGASYFQRFKDPS